MSNRKSSKKTVAAYIRRSDEKSEGSLDRQKAELRRLATSKGYKIAAWYIDDAVSGWKEKREEFQAMMRDVASGDFSRIITASQDRFSRFDNITFNHYLYLLRDAGVDIETIDHGLLRYDDLGQWLLTNVNQHGHSAYCDDLAKKIQSKLHQKALRGEWVSGRPPVGYVVDPESKKIVPDPVAAKHVVQAFRDYANGFSVQEVCDRLNEAGSVTKMGKPWEVTGVAKMLVNEVYIGVFRWGKTQAKRVANPERIVFIANNHPAVVDAVLWDTVQARLTQQRNAYARVTTPAKWGGGYLLTKLLKCGYCGAAMHGQTHKPTGLRVYKCSGKHKGCDAGHYNWTHQDELIQQVISALMDYYCNPKRIAKLKKQLEREALGRSKRLASPATIKKEQKTHRATLEKLQRRLLMVDDDMISIVQDELRAVKAKLEQLDIALAASEQTPVGSIVQQINELVDAALDQFKRLPELVAADTIDSRQAVRAILREHCESVNVWARPVDDREFGAVSAKSPRGGSGRGFVLERGEIVLKKSPTANVRGREVIKFRIKRSA